MYACMTVRMCIQVWTLQYVCMEVRGDGGASPNRGKYVTACCTCCVLYVYVSRTI